MIDKKRKDEIVAMRRLQQFSMNHLTGPSSCGDVHAGQAPCGPCGPCGPMKEEPTCYIKEIDSGCESPQEEMILKVIIFHAYQNV